MLLGMEAIYCSKIVYENREDTSETLQNMFMLWWAMGSIVSHLPFFISSMQVCIDFVFRTQPHFIECASVGCHFSSLALFWTLTLKSQITKTTNKSHLCFLYSLPTSFYLVEIVYCVILKTNFQFKSVCKFIAVYFSALYYKSGREPQTDQRSTS